MIKSSDHKQQAYHLKGSSNENLLVEILNQIKSIDSLMYLTPETQHLRQIMKIIESECDSILQKKIKHRMTIMKEYGV